MLTVMSSLGYNNAVKTLEGKTKEELIAISNELELRVMIREGAFINSLFATSAFLIGGAMLSDYMDARGKEVLADAFNYSIFPTFATGCAIAASIAIYANTGKRYLEKVLYKTTEQKIHEQHKPKLSLT